MSSLIKTVIIVAVIAGLGFVGYNYVSKGSTGEDLLVVKNDSTTQIGAQVLTALNQLQQLRLDENVFSDKTFKSLKDFSRPIPSEPVGRNNPFSPIGVEKSSGPTIVTATSTARQIKAIPPKTASKTVVKPTPTPEPAPEPDVPIVDENF